MDEMYLRHYNGDVKELVGYKFLYLGERRRGP